MPNYNKGYEAGARLAAEMNQEPHLARGGKVGVPHIKTRAGIAAPRPPMAKPPMPSPMAPPAAMAGPAAPAGLANIPGLSKGGKVRKYAAGGPVKKWIAGATKNKGALHRALKVPEGEKIPAAKLAKAADSKNPVMRKRAALAKTLSGMHKAKGGPVEGSKADMAEDKKGAKKAGVSMKKWESSAADAKQDKLGMKHGGKVMKRSKGGKC